MRVFMVESAGHFRQVVLRFRDEDRTGFGPAFAHHRFPEPQPHGLQQDGMLAQVMGPELAEETLLDLAKACASVIGLGPAIVALPVVLIQGGDCRLRWR